MLQLPGGVTSVVASLAAAESRGALLLPPSPIQPRSLLGDSACRPELPPASRSRLQPAGAAGGGGPVGEVAAEEDAEILPDLSSVLCITDFISAARSMQAALFSSRAAAPMVELEGVAGRLCKLPAALLPLPWLLASRPGAGASSERLRVCREKGLRARNRSNGLLLLLPLAGELPAPQEANE